MYKSQCIVMIKAKVLACVLLSERFFFGLNQQEVSVEKLTYSCFLLFSAARSVELLVTRRGSVENLTYSCFFLFSVTRSGSVE